MRKGTAIFNDQTDVVCTVGGGLSLQIYIIFYTYYYTESSILYEFIDLTNFTEDVRLVRLLGPGQTPYFT